MAEFIRFNLRLALMTLVVAGAWGFIATGVLDDGLTDDGLIAFAVFHLVLLALAALFMSWVLTGVLPKLSLAKLPATAMRAGRGLVTLGKRTSSYASKGLRRPQRERAASVAKL